MSYPFGVLNNAKDFKTHKSKPAKYGLFYCLDDTRIMSHTGLLYKENNMKKKFNHAYDFAFEVVSQKEDASDVTATMLRFECAKRINSLRDDELLEACGVFNTMETDQ